MYRTKEENMIQITITPVKPKDLVSFLQPIIAEVNTLYEKGLVIKKQNEVRFAENVAILGITGDIPGIFEIMNVAGNTHTYGCRVCMIKADTPAAECVHGKYFSTKSSQRSVDSLTTGDPVSNLSFNRVINMMITFKYRCMECVVFLH